MPLLYTRMESWNCLSPSTEIVTPMPLSAIHWETSRVSRVAFVVRLKSTRLPACCAFSRAYSTVGRITRQLSSVSPPKKVTWRSLASPESAINRSTDWRATSSVMASGTSASAIRSSPYS